MSIKINKMLIMNSLRLTRLLYPKLIKYLNFISQIALPLIGPEELRNRYSIIEKMIE
jgi:hypothetical protein